MHVLLQIVMYLLVNVGAIEADWLVSSQSFEAVEYVHE